MTATEHRPTAPRLLMNAYAALRRHVEEYRALWLIIIAAWSVMGVFISVMGLRFVFGEARYVGAWRVVASEFTYVSLWVLLFPLSLWLVRRIGLTRKNWWAVVPLHLAVGMACSFATNAARLGLYSLFMPDIFGQLRLAALVRLMNLFFDNGLMSYLFNTAVCIAFEHNRGRQEREQLALRLESQLTQAQLQTLKAQLHPHFLFNTLNSVAMLIRKGKNGAALEMLSGLSEFLRSTLEDFNTQTVSLDREVSLLQQYLDIQQVRFGERLATSVRIDGDCRSAEVPGLIMQPLVENAFRHGISRREHGGRIEVAARREGDRLTITVGDDGPGLAGQWPALQENGIGLSNTLARLDKLYGDGYSFILADRRPRGAEVRLSLPFREHRPLREGR